MKPLRAATLLIALDTGWTRSAIHELTMPEMNTYLRLALKRRNIDVGEDKVLADAPAPDEEGQLTEAERDALAALGFEV